MWWNRAQDLRSRLLTPRLFTLALRETDAGCCLF
uniref:Uncharacterized protein n=1 Tax=Anguilla anguilla TaxID=7936 RepID=A0A0E9S4R4_ANGAN